ncbi:MAG: folylpolyglutamate synthase/dihydrofolate synthase family protein [Granulosicoccus sp.]
MSQSRPPNPTDSLSQWLTWLETIHPVSIDMGLERVGQVADRLGMRPVDKPLVLVGGTNGKGSTVALLSAIYTAAGYRVGSYTSPHIVDFRERIRIDGEMAPAADIVQALAHVEAGRHPQTLTYFEYTTLAAMQVFAQHQCDIYLLEVGLGGRLDATNLWDADCSVVTSIALDHEEYLGSDVAVIATEKAAIGRMAKPLVVGDLAPPDSLFEYTKKHNIPVDHVGAVDPEKLPQSALKGSHQKRNSGCAVAVVGHLQHRLPVDEQTIEQALSTVTVPGRFEKVQLDGVSALFDVAHNPAGAAALASAFEDEFGDKRAQVLFACMADKDLGGILDALGPVAAHWHCVPLNISRAMKAEDLSQLINAASEGCASAYACLEDACSTAVATAREKGQPLLVAGSFFTIADVRPILEAPGSN